MTILHFSKWVQYINRRFSILDIPRTTKYTLVTFNKLFGKISNIREKSEQKRHLSKFGVSVFFDT